MSKYVFLFEQICFFIKYFPQNVRKHKKDAIFSELPEKVMIMPQSAFINDPKLSKSSKESTKMYQITIRNYPMFTESPEDIMKTDKNSIRSPSYDETPQYLLSDSDE